MSGPADSGLDRLTMAVLRRFNRRGLLKLVGTSVLAAAGWTVARGLRPIAVLATVCPPPTFGICDNCWSGCVNRGQGCSCTCESCDCQPPIVEAGCTYYPLSAECVFVCNCIPC